MSRDQAAPVAHRERTAPAAAHRAARPHRRRSGSTIPAAIYTLVMLLVLAGLWVVFAQVRFGESASYAAEFTDVSGLERGETVRVHGVEVGRVDAVEFAAPATEPEPGESAGAPSVTVRFSLHDDYRPRGTTGATVRYLNLVGDRYLELLDPGDAAEPADLPVAVGTPAPLPEGATIGVDRTTPALDLDALVGSFQPLFRVLEPGQVNRLSGELIAVLQGQQDDVGAIVRAIGEVTGHLADRDRVIGSVIAQLGRVLDTLERQQPALEQSLVHARELTSALAADSDTVASATRNLDDTAAELAVLAEDIRPPLRADMDGVDAVARQVDSRRDTLTQLLTELPETYRSLTRLGAYGGFFNYYLCGLQIRVSDLRGGSTTSPLFTQQGGRCAPA
ncbi:MCE family protein [Dietzia maris]